MTLQNGITKIGPNAFSNTRVTELHIPPSLHVFYANIFGSRCQKIYLPDGIEVITQDLVRAVEVQEIVVPDTVVEIWENAFAGHEELEKVSFAENSVLREIKSCAFARTGIEKFTAPASLRVLE